MNFFILCLFVFLGLIIVAVIIGVGGSGVEIEKRNERIRKKTSQRQNEREQIAQLVLEHHEALYQNWRRTVYVDEYGTVQLDDWEYEVENFLDSVNFVPEVLTIEASKNRVTKAMEAKAKQDGLEEFIKRSES